MIRVLQIGLSENLGGIENFIMNLYRNLDKSLIQFDFVIFGEQKPLFYDEIIKNGSRIYFVVPRRKNMYQNYKQLKNIIKNNNYKIVHFNVNTLSYVAPIIICNRLKNVKIIVHGHSEWKGKNIKTRFLHNLNMLRIRNINFEKFACSEVAGEWLYKEKKFKIIKNGIDIARFKFNEEKRKLVRKELKISERDVVIGHVGRFSSVKNHKFLIEIFNEFQKCKKNVKLLLVGDGPLKNEIERQIENLNIKNRVILVGNKKNVENYYNVMDAFVFPSLYEGFGMVLLEAQINGLSCLTSKDVVPNKVNITNHLKFISLEKSAKEWSEELEKMDFVRYNEIEKIRKLGYDIKHESQMIMNMYIELLKR